MFIKTFGCFHNASDSEYMAGILSPLGYEIVSSLESSDLTMINNCTVKSPSQATFLNSVIKSNNFKKKVIVFYNFNYELEMLRDFDWGEDVVVAEWNGHAHQDIPKSEKWLYLVQYTSGSEGWNCITTDTTIFFSQNYSYRTLAQASGRINRVNTPFTDLYY